MNTFRYLFLVFLLTGGCICADSILPPDIWFFKLRQFPASKNLQSYGVEFSAQGESHTGLLIDSVFVLQQDVIEGGASYFLGCEVSSLHPQDEKVFHLFEAGKKLESLSISQVYTLDSYIDTLEGCFETVYIIDLAEYDSD